MSSPHDAVIAEFRANEGRVGGDFDGMPLLLLHSRGARTGAERVNPMMYLPVGADWAVFASYGGRDVHPAWYHNLLTHPEASIEVGTGMVEVRARALVDDERDRVWTEQKRRFPSWPGWR